MPRILMRKYALISTDKFLDIGIVESISHVQIAISDIEAIACSYLMLR